MMNDSVLMIEPLGTTIPFPAARKRSHELTGQERYGIGHRAGRSIVAGLGDHRFRRQHLSKEV